MNRIEIEKALLKNAAYISKEYEKEIITWNGLVLSKDKLFVPGYIPYIGSDYLNSNSKIITYALSQNIHPNRDFVVRYANNWKNRKNIDEALNRQNLSFDNYGMVQMHPFDTGHLPILSGILTSLISKNENINPISNISATNLSKFSFRNSRNNTSDNEKSLNKCFWWFSKQELELLNPDYIICAGNRVFDIIKKNIGKLNINSKPIRVAFPSDRVINKHYKKSLTTNDKKKLELINSIFSTEFLNRKSSYKNKKKLVDIIKRDGYYFVKMFELIEEQIKKYGV